MKKFLIFWFICLFLISCSKKQEQIQDPISKALALSHKTIDKSIIKDDLNHFLKKYKQNWTDKNRNHCINILYCGQQEFQIDYKIILGLIATESEFRITVQRKNIRKGRVKSVDFGLTQQNSRYYKDRYRATIPYLKQYRIKYTDSKFDMAKNIFSCYMILSDTNKYGNLIHFKDFIASYNVGVHGTKHDYMQKTIDEYYNRFMKNYMEI